VRLDKDVEVEQREVTETARKGQISSSTPTASPVKMATASAAPTPASSADRRPLVSLGLLRLTGRPCTGPDLVACPRGCRPRPACSSAGGRSSPLHRTRRPSPKTIPPVLLGLWTRSTDSASPSASSTRPRARVRNRGIGREAPDQFGLRDAHVLSGHDGPGVLRAGRADHRAHGPPFVGGMDTEADSIAVEPLSCTRPTRSTSARARISPSRSALAGGSNPTSCQIA
jgi:hypothetical protein